MQETMIEQSMILLLGDTGISIMQAISKGIQDVESIHYFTGIPRPCIAGRLSALENIRMINKTSLGYVLERHGKEMLAALS